MIVPGHIGEAITAGYLHRPLSPTHLPGRRPNRQVSLNTITNQTAFDQNTNNDIREKNQNSLDTSRENRSVTEPGNQWKTQWKKKDGRMGEN